MKKMKIRYSQPSNSDDFDAGVLDAGGERTFVESIILTSEICGNALSPAAARLLASDLSAFDEAAVLNALARCRLELHGPLKVSDIIVRIDDGRPGADEAWALIPRSELASVVWTEEIAQAWGAASALLEADDVAGARAVFDDVYATAVLQARIKRQAVRWMPSLGSDAASRESVLVEAVKKGRLSAAQVEHLLPSAEVEVNAAPEQGPVKVKIRNLH
ncbi:MAG: hypothetical protein JWR25_515 [Noviherbaspirillum sp.]|nr:hypothetical protein [Noviherbaspirillum sp.]